MFLALFHEVHPAKCAFIRHLLRLDVFRREEQLLGIQQQDAGVATRVDHRIGFLERHTHGFFANDVLTGFGGIDRDRRVQAIGGSDRNHFDSGIAQQVVVVGVRLGDAVALGELGRMASGRRGDRHELGLFRDPFHRARNTVGLKAGAHDADFYFGRSAHRCGSHTATPTRESAVP